jgi:membrane-bound lytic murein transglycosylase A
VPAQWADLPDWRADDARAALATFRTGCRSLMVQAQSQARWTRVCAAAVNTQVSSADAHAFFETHFTPHKVLNGDDTDTGMITGYYEPILNGSRTRRAPFTVPLYGPPADMLTIDLGDQFPELKGKRVRGRVEGNKVVPFFSRAELEADPSRNKGRPLVYVEDAVEAMFLEIQGSGRIRLEDGTMLRMTYADQNGHAYRSIGRWLIDKGELQLHQASMQGIKAWAQANPSRMRELLDANPSYVFFREQAIPDPAVGPPGSLAVPLTPGRSMAVDRNAVPLGAPVFLATTFPLSDRPLHRLMVAQDTGGAIIGGVRGDFYWGTGDEAGREAGRMRQQGRMWVLLPK